MREKANSALIECKDLFQQNKTSDITDEHFLIVGRYASFLVNDETLVGQVLGFQYLNGSCKSYSLDYVPLEAPTKNSRGIGVLRSFFKVDVRTFELKDHKMSSIKYVNIESFHKHVFVKKFENIISLEIESIENLRSFLK